jgi:hypothetical protein
VVGCSVRPLRATDAYAHPYPLRFFDFANEVKMGAAFWNFVGGDDGTYDLLLALYREVGGAYAEQLDDLRAAVATRAG